MLYLKPFKTEIEKAIQEYLEINSKCGVSTQLVWDAMKAVVRGEIISLSSTHYKKKQKYRNELLLTIANLERQHKQTCSAKVYQALTEERRNLDLLESNQIQRNVLFLRQKYWLRTPKALKLLSWKVRSKQSSHAVHVIKDQEGKRRVDITEILTVFKDFYECL